MEVQNQQTSKDIQVLQLLKKYKFTHPKQIQQASKLELKISQWEAFLQENLPQEKHKEFKSELSKIINGDSQNMQIKQEPQDKNTQNELFKNYYNIKQNSINIKTLMTLNLQYSKWSDQLINQMQIKAQKQIQEYIITSKNLEQFIDKIVPYVYDMVMRRVDLVSYFNTILRVSSKVKSQTSKIISLFYFNDFIIFLLKYIKQKNIFGQLLSEIRISIPLFVEHKNLFQYCPQVLKNVLGLHNHHLILNIGTQKTHKCGKTKLISEIFSLDKRISQSSIFSSSLNFYSKFSFGVKQNAVLADFNGYINKYSIDLLKKRLHSIASKSSLTIFHVKQEQILEQKILQSTEYSQILQNSQKVLLLIRDKNIAVEKKIRRYIPKQLQNKVWIYLFDNLTQNDKSKELNKFAQFINEQKLNKYKDQKFNFECLFSQNQNNKFKAQVLIKEAMDQLYQKQFSKNKILPNVCITQQIHQKTKQFNLLKKNQNEPNDIYLQKYQNKKKEIQELKSQLNDPKLSKFMTKTFKIFKNFDMKYLQIFIQNITNWKNQNLLPLKKQFIQLTNNLYNCKDKNIQKKIKQNLKENIQKSSQYQISIDSVISQFVIYNKVKNFSQITKIIDNYYSNALSNMSPINIIDGKTLKFGNYVIEKLLKELNQIIQKQQKKIYVVSVIGAQSSAKSTLLNFLFRCGFQTSAGRCTKGVYLSVCYVQDIVIVILDTEGLLSVSARDAAFDNQIATFVLKISNLIIINNKGEITSTMKDLLKVCMYVLECLHKDEKKNQYTPQKVIFALRDQIKPTGNFQEEMVAQIKNSLQQMKHNDSINYQNFFLIQTDDIFSLPNAYLEIQGYSPKYSSFNSFDPIFGKCILALRTKMIKILKKTQPQQNFNSFYSSASSCWQTIWQCGQQILNFKTIHEIVVKRRLEEVLNQNNQFYREYMRKQYSQFFSQIKNFISSQLQNQNIKIKLKCIFTSNKKYVTEHFQNIVKDQCTNRVWIQDFFSKINDICLTIFSSYQQQLDKEINKKKSQQKLSQISKKYDQIVDKLLIEGPTNESIKQNFLKQKNNIWADFKIRRDKILKQKIKFNIGISNTLETCLSSQKQSMRLKISNVNQCGEKFFKIRNQISPLSSKWHCSIYSIKYQGNINQKDSKNIFLITNKILNNFNDYLIEEVSKNKISTYMQITQNFLKWLHKIHFFVDQLQRQIKNLSSFYFFTKIDIKLNMIQSVLIGSMYHTLTNQMHSNKLIDLSEQQIIQIKMMTKKQKQIQKALDIRGNSSLTLQMWIQKFIQQIGLQIQSKCIEQLRKKLLKIKLTLDPQKIISIAMKRSLLQQNGKRKWRQCFKLISDINKYLFQIMCEQQEILTKNSIVTQQIIKSKQQSLKRVSQIIKQLQKIDLENSLQVQIQMKKMKLIYLDNKTFTKEIIFKSFIEKLKTNTNSIVFEIQNHLDQKQLNQKLDYFIQNQLRSTIIGCQSCCPLCGMKCKKRKNHEQGHQVMKNCHLMEAFAGVRIIKTNHPSYDICYSKKGFQRRWHKGQTSYQNGKQYISKNYPDWNNHFPQLSQDYLYQGIQNEVNFCTIWANIQDILVPLKCPSMIQDYKYKNLVNNPLNKEDLDIKYQNYKGELISLRAEYMD